MQEVKDASTSSSAPVCVQLGMLKPRGAHLACVGSTTAVMISPVERPTGPDGMGPVSLVSVPAAPNSESTRLSASESDIEKTMFTGSLERLVSFVHAGVDHPPRGSSHEAQAH